jgi:nickel transport protein
MRSIPRIVALLLLAAGPAAGHELHHTVVRGEAIIVRIEDDDGGAFAGQRYEVFREGEAAPYQAGRTDVRGTVAFVPDRDGVWRIRAFSEDGHGVDFSFEVDEGLVTAETRPLFERYGRIVVGVALVFGLFGAGRLFLRGRAS